MFDKIINETLFTGNINDLLLIYGFGDDFLMGGGWYTEFNIKVGEK